jgi:hypothetical protein
MSYELTISIEEDSLEALNIERLVEAEHLTREEAARRLLTMASPLRRVPTRTEALAFLGGGREDAELLDEVKEIIVNERRRGNNSSPTLVSNSAGFFDVDG